MLAAIRRHTVQSHTIVEEWAVYFGDLFVSSERDARVLRILLYLWKHPEVRYRDVRAVKWVQRNSRAYSSIMARRGYMVRRSLKCMVAPGKELRLFELLFVWNVCGTNLVENKVTFQGAKLVGRRRMHACFIFLVQSSWTVWRYEASGCGARAESAAFGERRCAKWRSSCETANVSGCLPSCVPRSRWCAAVRVRELRVSSGASINSLCVKTET